jgi:hypothetical protein
MLPSFRKKCTENRIYGSIVMENISILPTFVTQIFKKLPMIFKDSHKRSLIWFVLLLAIGVGNHKLTNMAQSASVHTKEWRFRRFLSAGYWCLRAILIWLVDEIIKDLPKPKDGTIYLIGDGSKKEKRSKKNPYMQKGKIRQGAGWFFGIRFCVLMMSWNNFRIPVDFEILYPKKHKKYRNENKLFREMLKRFVAPAWAKQVIVLCDAGYASTENLQYIRDRGELDKKTLNINWYFCFAIAKTVKFDDNKSLKDLCRHLNKNLYRKTFISGINTRRQKCYWTFSKTVQLRDVGEVTIVLSKKRRNCGPKNVKVIVTNLPNPSIKTVLNIYQKRFLIEVLFRELKSGMGLGKQQVTKNEKRIENSIGCSILAYLLLLKLQHKDIIQDEPWSIFKLRENLRFRVFRSQAIHDYQLLEMKKAA